METADACDRFVQLSLLANIQARKAILRHPIAQPLFGAHGTFSYYVVAGNPPHPGIDVTQRTPGATGGALDWGACQESTGRFGTHGRDGVVGC